jgi:hypothetical protein
VLQGQAATPRQPKRQRHSGRLHGPLDHGQAGRGHGQAARPPASRISRQCGRPGGGSPGAPRHDQPARNPRAQLAQPLLALTAQVEIPDNGANGVLLNLGGHSDGWSFYLKDSRPSFCYNLFGLQQTIIRADQPVPAGEHQVRMEFAYDGGGLAKGGTVTLYLDGNQIGAGRVEQTEGIGFGYEYTDVGRDALSPVTDDSPPGDTAFTLVMAKQ